MATPQLNNPPHPLDPRQAPIHQTASCPQPQREERAQGRISLKPPPSPWALLESDDEYKDKYKDKYKDEYKYTVKENHQTVSAGWIGLKFKLIFISLWLYSIFMMIFIVTNARSLKMEKMWISLY